MAIGEVSGVAVGQWFADRAAVHQARVHRPLQAGICKDEDGPAAESIVLSGGFPDDEEHEDWIVYTGQGGLNRETNRQEGDQELLRGNRALKVSQEQGLPVRVVRRCPDPARGGYEYIGLWRVEQAWFAPSNHGPGKVWRFKLVPLEKQVIQQPPATPGQPRRAEVRTSRVIRDTDVARWVKEQYDYTCQVCRTRLETPGGAYAEGAHIRPLGRPHDGPDEPQNILCLCPNCHVVFDAGGFVIAEDGTLVGREGRLWVVPANTPKGEHLRYRMYQYNPKT